MISDLKYRLRALFRRRTVETEMEDELRFHFERQIEKNRDIGMPREEALRQAHLSFGGETQIKERCRDARGISFLDTSIQDIRYGFRGLCKRPSFTAVAILTIAVGIAVNVSVFAFFQALFLQAVPARDPAVVAQAEMKTLWSQFRKSHPDLDDERDITLVPAVGVEGSSRTYFRTLLKLLLAVAGALLLVVCANIGGLLIAQGSARRAEFAVRRALGASSLRLIRQLLTETLLLAGSAGVLGLGISAWISHSFSSFYSTDSEGYRHI